MQLRKGQPQIFVQQCYIAYPSQISRWMTTQKPQQGFITVVCQRNQNLTERVRMSKRVKLVLKYCKTQ